MKLERLENRLDKEMADAQGKMVRLEDKNDQLTKELSDARDTIVTMQHEMNQMNNDLMLLLRQSTFKDKYSVAADANGSSSGDNEATSVLVHFLYLIASASIKYFSRCQLN